MDRRPLVPPLAVRLVDDLHKLAARAQAEGRHDALARLIGAQLSLLLGLASWNDGDRKPAKRRAAKRRSKP